VKDDLFISPSEKRTPVDWVTIDLMVEGPQRVAARFLAAKEKYPWGECIKDQVERYGDKETAEKVCGKIKAQFGKKADEFQDRLRREYTAVVPMVAKQVKDDAEITDLERDVLDAMGDGDTEAAWDAYEALQNLAYPAAGGGGNFRRLSKQFFLRAAQMGQLGSFIDLKRGTVELAQIHHNLTRQAQDSVQRMRRELGL
jgi:hypothetical protein